MVEVSTIKYCNLISIIMIHSLPIPSAYPTPFIFTLGACQVLTSSVFLYRHIALRTSLRFNCNCPFFKLFSLILLTGKILMPCNEALKAEYLFAVVACDLNRCFRWNFHHNILAFVIWTELFQVTPHYFLIGFKLFKPFVCYFIAYFLDKFIWYRLFAPFLRTFYEETLGSWLGNLKIEEVSVTIFAKGVSTASIGDKISLIMFFITDFAKFNIWIFNLLRFNDELILKVV
jgi:hypothetical protein